MTEDTGKTAGEATGPKTADDYSKSGWTHLAAHEWDQAESDFRMALSMDPVLVEALYGLAMTLKMKGETSEAIETFTGVDSLLKDGAYEDTTRAEMLRTLARAQRDMIAIEQNRDSPL